MFFSADMKRYTCTLCLCTLKILYVSAFLYFSLLKTKHWIFVFGNLIGSLRASGATLKVEGLTSDSKWGEGGGGGENTFFSVAL